MKRKLNVFELAGCRHSETKLTKKLRTEVNSGWGEFNDPSLAGKNEYYERKEETVYSRTSIT